MSNLKRLTNWQTRHYHDFLEERANQPFQWQTNDCCTFAADAVLAQTGTDIASEFRGTYTTKLGAFKAIKKVTGGNSIEDAVEFCANKHNMVEYKFPLQAQRGDLCVVDNGEGELIAAVVTLQGNSVVSVGENGLLRLSLANIKRAWKVSEHV